MLIEFTVGNYRSFKDPVTFSMVAAKLRAKNKALDENNVFPLTDKISLLKSCAIYGANASGKSNLVQAFRFMRHFVLNSATGLRVDEPIDVDRFRLSTETEDEPSFFEIVFYAEDRRYRYGFTVDKQKIHSEWLYHAKVKETNLFYRDNGEFELSSTFKEGKGLPEKTRGNALFLSVVAQFNGAISRTVLRWFRQLWIMLGIEDIDRELTVDFLGVESRRTEILSFIRQMDLGIIDIDEAEQGEHRPLVNDGFIYAEQPLRVTTMHRKFSKEKLEEEPVLFDLDQHESEGTKKIFALAGDILYVFGQGLVLIIDELDARLHPLLTKAIIRLFNSNETNPNNAQLIFTTHDTNLLTNKLFRRDQIWFTEKNKFGATDLYSLAEIKNVRSDASFEKDYITGKYGAIPFIGGMQRLVEGADG